jgi:hypothetical protein
LSLQQRSLSIRDRIDERKSRAYDVSWISSRALDVPATIAEAS